MVLKVGVVRGDEPSKVDVNRSSGEVTCHINESIGSPELYTLLLENLRGHEELTIELSDFRGLGLSNVDDWTLELFIRHIHSFLNFPPFSLKSDKSPSK